MKTNYYYTYGFHLLNYIVLRKKLTPSLYFGHAQISADERQVPMEILLVEPNAGDICLIKEAIKETAINCNLTVFQDGSKAISYISENYHSIDFLILSTNILRVNADEILQICRSKSLLKDIPIIIFGDIDNEENANQENNPGEAYFLKKPMNLAEYFTTVKSMIKMQ